MDEVLRRLAIAYLGFTAALWAISGGMAMNGAAFERNYAWGFVSSLRLVFTAPLLLAALGATCVAIAEAWAEVREERQKALLAREQFEKERQEAEARKRKAEVEEQLRARRAVARLAREHEERAEAKRRERERQRQEAIEKKARSARRAAERALDDF